MIGQDHGKPIKLSVCYSSNTTFSMFSNSSMTFFSNLAFSVFSLLVSFTSLPCTVMLICIFILCITSLSFAPLQNSRTFSGT